MEYRQYYVQAHDAPPVEMKMANDMPQPLAGGGDLGSPRTAKGGVSNV